MLTSHPLLVAFDPLVVVLASFLLDLFLFLPPPPFPDDDDDAANNDVQSLAEEEDEDAAAPLSEADSCGFIREREMCV